MAGFSRFNRKAALLVAKLAEMGFTDSNTKIDFLGRKPLNTFRSWQKSKKESTHSEQISDGLKYKLTISDTRNLLSDDVSVQEFSILLGYTIQQGREIIDQAYDELYPTYSIFYSGQRAAKDILDRFHGLHLIYRVESGDRVKEFTRRDSNIVQMPLSIRYMIKGTKDKVTELFRVRCKLTLPSYKASTPKPFFEYDGYITPQKYDTHNWLFENRNELRADMPLEWVPIR